MYKWHVNSAIGRSRPLSHDIQRVVDGIAASLRHFSASVSRAEEDGEVPKTTRAQKGAAAAKEILSAPRGIDARSLAAKPPSGPPQTFRITRELVDGPSRRGMFPPRRGNQNQPGGGAADRNHRSAQSGMRRGGARGGRARAGKGRGRRERRKRAPKAKTAEEDDMPEPFNEEEIKWMAGDVGGWPTPYEPKTSVEQLLGKGLTVMGSAGGTLEAAMVKVQIGTDNVNGPHRHSDEHLVKMDEANGTFFESAEAKAVTQKYLNERRKLRADRLEREFTPTDIPTLPEAEREKLSKAWIAGQYVKPEPAAPGDILGLADTYAKLNETYLPEDSRKLQAKLASLLPSFAQKSAVSQPVQKPL